MRIDSASRLYVKKKWMHHAAAPAESEASDEPYCLHVASSQAPAGCHGDSYGAEPRRRRPKLGAC